VSKGFITGYLPTDLPDLRTKAVLPADLIDDDDENPYYPDAVEKYFARPHNNEFVVLTYPDYFRFYNVTTKKTSQISSVLVNWDIGSIAVELPSLSDINMCVSKTPKGSSINNYYFNFLLAPNPTFSVAIPHTGTIFVPGFPTFITQYQHAQAGSQML
jgi:hypothetical protein